MYASLSSQKQINNKPSQTLTMNEEKCRNEGTVTCIQSVPITERGGPPSSMENTPRKENEKPHVGISRSSASRVGDALQIPLD